MYRSGTNAPSSTVSSLRVARIPSTSQVSVIVTPLAPRGIKAWTILGAAGLLVSMPCKPRRVHAGVKLPKAFRPVNRYPPSTRSALVVDKSAGRSFPVSAWPAANTSPATTSFRSHSSEGSRSTSDERAHHQRGRHVIPGQASRESTGTRLAAGVVAKMGGGSIAPGGATGSFEQALPQLPVSGARCGQSGTGGSSESPPWGDTQGHSQVGEEGHLYCQATLLSVQTPQAQEARQKSPAPASQHRAASPRDPYRQNLPAPTAHPDPPRS